MKVTKKFLSFLCVMLTTASVVKAADETEPLSVLKIAIPNMVSNPDDRVEPDSLYFYIELSQQPIVQCYHQKMTVKWQDTEEGLQELQMETGVSMQLIRASDIPNAINTPQEQTSQLVFDIKEPNVVRVRGLKQGKRVTAFSTSGQSVKTVVANANGEATLSIKSLAHGVYVISAGERETFKIVKQ